MGGTTALQVGQWICADALRAWRLMNKAIRRRCQLGISSTDMQEISHPWKRNSGTWQPTVTPIDETSSASCRMDDPAQQGKCSQQVAVFHSDSEAYDPIWKHDGSLIHRIAILLQDFIHAQALNVADRP